jgi:hypothetical protein
MTVHFIQNVEFVTTQFFIRNATRCEKIDLHSSGVVQYNPIQNENCFEKRSKG